MGTVAQLTNKNRFASESDRGELREIIRQRSFREGHFVLASGKESNLYFNMKPTMFDPRGAELVARIFMDKANEAGADILCGLEMGAVPTLGAITAVSSMLNHPMKAIFVRKKPKDHGTRDLLEGLAGGESLEGKKVLAIDDVATSGGSIHQAIEAIRNAGGIVEFASAIVDRQEGGAEFLREKGVRLIPIFTAQDFVSEG